MKKTIGGVIVLAFLIASFCFIGCAAQKERKPPSTPAAEKAAVQRKIQPLFYISRNKNSNIVHDDARLTADGKLDPAEPVIAYWVMLAEKGQREELNSIERREAYGFNIKPDPSVNGYKMTLTAAPQKQVIVRKAGDVIRAEMVIGGRLAVLEKIYINASDSLLGPKVHYIMLYGKDLKTGGARSQKIVPK